jgi:hypothetical protein
LLENPPLPPNINHVIETFRNMSAEEVVAGIAATCIIIAETAESSSRNVDAIDAFLRDARDCIELARAKMMTIASSTSAGGGGQGGGMMYNANAKNVAPPPQQNYQQHRPQQQQQQQQWNYNDRRAGR